MKIHKKHKKEKGVTYCIENKCLYVCLLCYFLCVNTRMLYVLCFLILWQKNGYSRKLTVHCSIFIKYFYSIQFRCRIKQEERERYRPNNSAANQQQCNEYYYDGHMDRRTV